MIAWCNWAFLSMAILHTRNMQTNKTCSFYKILLLFICNIIIIFIFFIRVHCADCVDYSDRKTSDLSKNVKMLERLELLEKWIITTTNCVYIYLHFLYFFRIYEKKNEKTKKLGRDGRHPGSFSNVFFNLIVLPSKLTALMRFSFLSMFLRLHSNCIL